MDAFGEDQKVPEDGDPAARIAALLAELADRERRFNESQQLSKVGSWEWFPANGVVLWSPEMYRIFDVSPETFNPSVRSATEVFHPEDQPLVLAATQKAIETKSPQPLEARVICRDGTVRYVRAAAAAILDQDGNLLRMHGTYQDISELKEIEMALRQSETAYRSIMDQAADGVLVMNADQKYIDVNAAACEMLGYSREEILALSTGDLVVTDPELGGLLRFDKLDGGKPVISQRYLRRRDGTIFPIEANSRKLPDGRMVGIVRDVSHRKLMDSILERNVRLEALGELAGGLAHDFNNLLSGIFGYMELAAAQTDAAAMRAVLGRAAPHLDRARRLTTQILTFARGGNPDMQVADVRPLVRSTAEFALAGSGVLLTMQKNETLWPALFDRGQLAQVIENLVINARQASGDTGQIEIITENVPDVEGTLPGIEPGDLVRISVRDFAGGIPSDIMPRIFDPFFTTKPGGKGLGLSTSFSIIKRHGGILTVDSQPGRGSTFSIYLRRGFEMPPNVQASEQEPGHSARHFLIMDDEPIIREILGSYLSTLGHSFVEAPDGEEALNLFFAAESAGHPVAAALVDLTVPGKMGGAELIRLLREKGSSIPIFVISGYSADRVDSLSGLVTAFLNKPFTQAEVIRMLETHLS